MRVKEGEFDRVVVPAWAKILLVRVGRFFLLPGIWRIRMVPGTIECIVLCNSCKHLIRNWYSLTLTCNFQVPGSCTDEYGTALLSHRHAGPDNEIDTTDHSHKATATGYDAFSPQKAPLWSYELSPGTERRLPTSARHGSGPRSQTHPVHLF